MMEAIAYQALVEGTCEAVCEGGAPQPCLYGELHCISSRVRWTLMWRTNFVSQGRLKLILTSHLIAVS